MQIMLLIMLCPKHTGVEPVVAQSGDDRRLARAGWLRREYPSATLSVNRKSSNREREGRAVIGHGPGFVCCSSARNLRRNGETPAAQSCHPKEMPKRCCSQSQARDERAQNIFSPFFSPPPGVWWRATRTGNGVWYRRNWRKKRRINYILLPPNAGSCVD